MFLSTLCFPHVQATAYGMHASMEGMYDQNKLP